MAKKHLRKRHFIDAKVQGVLLARTAGYWLFCLLAIASMLICWSILTGPTQPFYIHIRDVIARYGPAMIFSLLMLPLVLLDSVRLSNRFAGPVYRLRRSMRDLAFGKPVEPISFRNDDFWQEAADEFNAVAARLQNAAATPAEKPAPSDVKVNTTENIAASRDEELLGV